jgi:hypothetical protein
MASKHRISQAVIYIPQPGDATQAERWDIVAASLRAAGVTDIRPAPMPAQTYVPRQLRSVMLSSAEI